MSPPPGNIIIGKFIQGPLIPSLLSDPSDARELFLEEALLDIPEQRRLIYSE